MILHANTDNHVRSTGNDEDDTIEWRTIVEQQQREIEFLREQVAGGRDDDSFATHGNDADSSTASVVSWRRPLSPLSSLGSVLAAPVRMDDCVDSEHFEALCNKLQRAQRKLTKRDVQLHKARAAISASHKELYRFELEVAPLQLRVSALTADLDREQLATQQAVEHAAMALLRCDERDALVHRLEGSESKLRAELLVHQSRGIDAERALLEIQQVSLQQQRQISTLSSERDALVREVQTRAANEQTLINQVGRLEQQKNEHDSVVARLNEVLRQQTDSMYTQQQQASLALEAAQAQCNTEIQRARDEHSRHAVHLLHESLAQQQRVETAVHAEEAMQRRASEMQERNTMALEEIEQLRLQDACLLLQIRQCDADYALLAASHRDLVRAASGMELSQRDLMMTVKQSKKKIDVLQRALGIIDHEIQQLSRAVATNRSRDQSIARALREYSKRNRALEDAVGAARRQLRSVLESLRASERCKSRAEIEASALKRNLVVEQCQRSTLLHECSELESCLAQCHAAATASQSRAQHQQRENRVLEDALTQLCAYSQALVASQQGLQRELTTLEVEGKREPCVYG